MFIFNEINSQFTYINAFGDNNLTKHSNIQNI